MGPKTPINPQTGEKDWDYTPPKHVQEHEKGYPYNQEWAQDNCQGGLEEWEHDSPNDEDDGW